MAAGATLALAFHPDDQEAVLGLLGPHPAGPVWVRLTAVDDAAVDGAVVDGAVAQVTALAVPASGAKGWLVQVRECHRWTPPVDEQAPDPLASQLEREQVLDEVAWLLDDFASVGEVHGTRAGSEVLRTIAGRISDALRSGDLVARLEDDQLLVILRGVHHLRGAIRVANKIRASVEDPISLSFGEIVQTASVGVTLISRGESVDSVLERAEEAMGLARRAGGNTVKSSPPI
jgi:diguanylate cyclase (GGDEF)-like protein